MPFRIALPAIVSILLAFAIVSPAGAGGEIVITQAKALAGAVTPGDTPGYPVTLSQPGAYVLESNLTVTPGTYGLFVTANNVDIDMNGFTLSGNGGGTYGLISGFGESSIHGGVINRFRNSGIYLRNNTWTIEDMKIVRNGSMGIDATSASHITLRNSVVASNGSVGVQAGNFGRIENSTITSNSGYGLSLLDNVVIDSSTISMNSFAGIFMTGGGRIEGNYVDGNGAEGIITQNGSLVTANSVKNNVSYGIWSAGVNSGISNNYLRDNSINNLSQINGGSNVYGNTCVGKPC